jgi:hypothetical protein
VNQMLTRYSLLFVLLIVPSFSLFAGNELKVVMTSPNSLDILINISDDISGIQFSVHSSSNIRFETVLPGPLTANSSWIVGSFNANDSTVNVLMLNTRQESFPHGAGVLASLKILDVESKERKFVMFSNVLAIDPLGDSLEIHIANLIWQENNLPAAETEEMKSGVFGQNYPNPFNPTTILNYQLKMPAVVRLSVYDITGREVTRLIDGYQNAGVYQTTWNSTASNGQKVSSGVYFARLSVNQDSFTQKIMLTK